LSAWRGRMDSPLRSSAFVRHRRKLVYPMQI